jgi:glycosyltransferase involved in cell wall biosynthesis
MNITISIIVPTFSQSKKLERLLASIDELDAPPKEVIVVDDASTDGTPHLLDKWYKNDHRFHARYVSLNENMGPAKARNVGIHTATGNIVAFTDSDCKVDRRWLSEITMSLDKSKKIVGAGGRVLPMKKNLVSLYSTFHRVLEPPSSLLYLVTANCCFFRNEVLDVNGFDEDIRNPGGEDIGLSIKLIKKGWQFTYSPAAIVYHEFRSSIIDFYRTYRRYGEGCALVASRYLK